MTDLLPLVRLAVAAFLVALTLTPFLVLVLVVVHFLRVGRLPTSDGRAPLDHPLAGRYWDVEEIRAGAVVPEKLSWKYAPHLSVRQDRQEAPPALPAPGASPPARELLSLPAPLVFGVAEDGPATADLLTSVGVGGVSRSGKTGTVAFLAVQLLLRQAAVSVGDPHAGAPLSLSRRLQDLGFKPQLGSTPDDILGLARQVHAELQRRIRLAAVGAAPAPYAAAIVIDEWVSQVRGERGAELASILGRVVTEGGKFGVVAVLSAAAWQAAIAGGSWLRNGMPASIAHRMQKRDAVIMTGVSSEALADVALLRPGQGLLSDAEGLRRISVPLLRAEDLPVLRPHLRPAYVPNSAAYVPTHPLDVVRTQAGSSGDVDVDVGQVTEVVSLFRSGMGLTAALKSVTGTAPAGRRYDALRVAVEDALRRDSGG